MCGLQWTMTTDFIVHHREPSCTIVKFLYYLANLRHYYNGRCWSQRYKSGTNNRAKTIFIDFT
jgi:hypothetical protein